MRMHRQVDGFPEVQDSLDFVRSFQVPEPELLDGKSMAFCARRLRGGGSGLEKQAVLTR